MATFKNKEKSTTKKKKLRVLNKEGKEKEEEPIVLPEDEFTQKKDLYMTEENKNVTKDTLGYEAETSRLFASLKGSISEETMKAVEKMGFKTMTEIQAKSIPMLLEGNDVRGTAKTGSGKTLAFLIPVVELIVRLKYQPKHGTGVIIVSPTRELSIQTFGGLTDLMEYHQSHTYGLIMGGTNRKSEAVSLSQGVNIIVATPGRLLDHLQNTKRFVYKNLTCLVIDEADRILDVGFEEEMKQIIRLLPKNRQTMLFSATITSKTQELAKLALSTRVLEVDVDYDKIQATTDGLKQTYVICPMEKRFLLLYTFIKKHIKEKKVMVFFSSCMAVKFYHELLNFVDMHVKCIHGKKKQTNRTLTFGEFSKAESGVLLCTDVAARGWDIPAVDWIVQYDPPDDPKEYIHRVGRTARAGNNGQALLFLTEEEIGFVNYLKAQKVNVDPMDIEWKKVANIQDQLEKLILKNYYLQQSAKQAFASYVRAFDSHSLKDIYDISKLDLNKVAKCFGFTAAPFVNIGPFSIKSQEKRKRDDYGQMNNKKKLKTKRFKQH